MAEVLLFFAAKAVLAHMTATTVGGMAAGAATAAAKHYAANEAALHASSYLLAHGSSNIAMHGAINYAAATAASVGAASTALGATFALGTGAWGAYSLAAKVAEMRNESCGDATKGEEEPCRSYSIKSRTSQTPAGLLRSTQTAYDTTILRHIFDMIFALLDHCVAEMEHNDQLGNHKTELAQMAPCSGCRECIDFDQLRSGSTICKCGCAAGEHRTLSLNQTFQRGGPGYIILKIIAEAVYPELERVDAGDLSVVKTELKAGQACRECGCGDSTFWQGSQCCCSCGHLGKDHTASYDENQSREIDTYLSIVGDRIYRDMSQYDPHGCHKTSLFNIRPGPGSCVDFDFSRWALWRKGRWNMANCRCTERREDHDQSVAETLARLAA